MIESLSSSISTITDFTKDVISGQYNELLAKVSLGALVTGYSGYKLAKQVWSHDMDDKIIVGVTEYKHIKNDGTEISANDPNYNIDDIQEIRQNLRTAGVINLSDELKSGADRQYKRDILRAMSNAFDSDKNPDALSAEHLDKAILDPYKMRAKVKWVGLEWAWKIAQNGWVGGEKGLKKRRQEIVKSLFNTLAPKMPDFMAVEGDILLKDADLSKPKTPVIFSLVAEKGATNRGGKIWLNTLQDVEGQNVPPVEHHHKVVVELSDGVYTNDPKHEHRTRHTNLKNVIDHAFNGGDEESERRMQQQQISATIPFDRRKEQPQIMAHDL